MKIDFTKLRGCQLVIFGGENIFVKLCRFFRTGFKEWEDKSRPTGIGITYEIRGRIFIIEVIGHNIKNGLRLVPFGRYLNNTKKYIIDIQDNTYLNYANREMIQIQMTKDLDYTTNKVSKGTIGKVLTDKSNDSRVSTCAHYIEELLKDYVDFDPTVEHITPKYFHDCLSWVPIPGWKLEE